MTVMQAHDVGVDDPAWPVALERIPHDVYHQPGYAQASAIPDRGVARAVIVSDGGPCLVLPYIRRELDGGTWDATSPYGYAGPVWRPDWSEEGRESALVVALDILRQQGCVSLFVRGHPELGRPWPTGVLTRGPATNLTHTVLLDLTRTPTAVWEETVSGHRNEINRANRAGYVNDWDDEFQWYDDFKASYLQDMRRLGARDYFLFDEEYFYQLRFQLGPHLRLGVSHLNGEFAAGSIFLLGKPWAHYHLATTTAAHRKASPGKALMHFARTDLAREGYSWLHLGGGFGGAEDPLFRFKAGFTAGRADFPTAGIILDQHEYARRNRGRVIDRAFFPAYRGTVDPSLMRTP